MPKTLGAHHQLPDNPSWIEIPRSDGDASRWPSNNTAVVDADGHVNYFRPVSLDEGPSVGWRLAIGKALAAKLDYAGQFVAKRVPISNSY
jgi:hypothetical protein